MRVQEGTAPVVAAVERAIRAPAFRDSYKQKRAPILRYPSSAISPSLIWREGVFPPERSPRRAYITEEVVTVCHFRARFISRARVTTAHGPPGAATTMAADREIERRSAAPAEALAEYGDSREDTGG